MRDRRQELAADIFAVVVLVLIVAVMCALSSCTAPAQTAAGSLTALAALTQMLHDGAVTIEQFTALKAALEASDGNWMRALFGGGLAALMAYYQAKRNAVKDVMKMRGPTEQERRSARGAS